ncbi:superoxide dismutase family protein [Xanthobacter versatilis]|uniref:superoxide dismutase family protein n=1 Tax=Xanthobacter autotrophicus (strain ATCC BAA-1158 / Py2) TaxID=78245 RepID=UPI00372B792F
MGSKHWLLAASILVAGAPAALAQTPEPAPAPAAPAAPAPTVVKADLVGNSGKPIGSATATGTDRVTIVRLVLQPGAIPAGWHGIHFHAVADCSDTEKFLASKAHVNHGGKAHGLLNPNGPDDGDLPNIFAVADGSVSAEVTSPVGLTGANGLLGPTGFALVVHAGPDDHTTQPIGGAGARIACAAFKP